MRERDAGGPSTGCVFFGSKYEDKRNELRHHSVHTNNTVSSVITSTWIVIMKWTHSKVL